MAFQGSGKKDLHKIMQGTDQRVGQGSTPMYVQSYANKSEQSSYSASKLKDNNSDDEHMIEEENAESGCKGAFQTQGQIIATGQHKTAQWKGGYDKKREQRDQIAFENQGRKGLYQKDNVHNQTQIYGTVQCKDSSPVVEDMIVEEYADPGGKNVQIQRHSFTTDRQISTKGRSEYDQRGDSWRTKQSDPTYMTSPDRSRKGDYYQTESRKDSGKEGTWQYCSAGHSKMDDSKRNIPHEHYQRKDNYGQNPHQIAMAEDEYSDHAYRSDIQMQRQLQRSKEASKQMLYGVFGNVISILEEFEERELAQRGHKLRMPRSLISIPSQKHKGFEDIKRLVEGQLFMFENQTKACPPEAFAELKNDLRRRTISWAAVRSESGIEGIQQTDIYISKLYEVLAKGSTKHYFPERCNASAGIIKTVFGAFMKGNHDKETLDESFRANTNKKAMGPETRSSELLTDGARRIALANEKRELDHHLQNDLEGFKQEGPKDLR